MASVGKPLPWSLREAIWKLLADGKTHRAIAAELQVSKRTVGKYANRPVQRRQSCSLDES